MSVKEKKKLDAGVLIAIIGLVGTLIAAALSSPLLIKLIERTPVPEITATTPPPGNPTLVFNEDFEDGQADGFAILSGQWQVRKTGNNSYYEIKGTSSSYPGAQAIFGPNSLANGTVHLQFNLAEAGEYYLTLRDQDQAEYTLMLDSETNSVELVYSDEASGWSWQTLGERAFTFNKTDWYTLDVTMAGAQFTVKINEQEILIAQDDRIASGELKLILQPGLSARIDNLAVWSAGN